MNLHKIDIHFYGKLFRIAAIVFFIYTLAGCKKLVEVDSPSDRLVNESTFAQDQTAVAAVNYFYSALSNEAFVNGGFTALTTFAGLGADELKILNSNTDQSLQAYYTNQLRVVYSSAFSTQTFGGNFWVDGYGYIYKANAAIYGLENSSTLTPSVKSQLLGEAKFFRAFYYFYLVNLYGGVPLALSTDYSVTVALPRAPVSDVYDQIIKDLNDAESLLSNTYLGSDRKTTSAERIYVTKWAVKALLARVYLYTRDYSNSILKASELINNTSMFGLNTLDGAFLKNNAEAIWQLQPVNSNWNTNEGRYFILPNTGPNTSDKPFYLNEDLVNSFEIGDQRKVKWIGSITPSAGLTYYYAYKYKKGQTADASITSTGQMTEYSTVFRLAELYLIRAEAEANSNQIADAQNDINKIRNRAGLPNTSAISQIELVNAILKERRVELFTEWGQRWLDLKRANVIDEVMKTATPAKGGNSWQPSQALYPIYQQDIIQNTKLIQNIGY